MNRRIVAVLAVAVLLIYSTLPAAHGDIIFNFTYLDTDDGNATTDDGFMDPTFGATRRATVTAVGNYINTIVDHSGTVDIRWEKSVIDPGSSTLASMGPFFFENDGFQNGFVFDHATTGIDPTPSEVDGAGSVNFGRTWNNGLGAPGLGEFDLFSVVLHEMTHAMGFVSTIESDGGFGITGTRSVFDSLLEDSAGNRLLDGTGSLVEPVSDLTSEDLQIDLTAIGEGTKDIYAPDPFEDGSSLSHLDPGSHAGSVMTPSIAAGELRRSYSDSDRAVIQALGWNVVAVPEPNSSFLMLSVLSYLCGYRRRPTQGR
ncbi:MAG TPA: hypothetical protein DDW52_16805 [Planctomycetaceae bacterium]|nr:hypothetical protein [Planctomycetaceae bacterium]